MLRNESLVTGNVTATVNYRRIIMFFAYADGDMNVWEYLLPVEQVQGGLMTNQVPVLPFTPHDTVGSVFSDSLLTVHLNKGGIEYWKSILDVCIENGIELVLVKYPISKHCYYEEIRGYGVLELRLEKILIDLKVSYKILDYHSLYFGQDEMFRDPNHLISREPRSFLTQCIKRDVSRD